MKIEPGRVVRMHYTLTGADGATIETSVGDDPMVYLHGAGQIIPGLENALAGSAAGTKRRIVVPPEDAYGVSDPGARIRVPVSEFPPKMGLAPGIEVQASTPDGPVTFLVVAIEGDEVVLDGNHPLAGKTLTFDVEVLEVREATPDEIAHRHAHGTGGAHGHA
ncbi:MAG TPA: peptidylprolyl isomerase [Candidatus Polarisedimenticolaceae bacterium]|nr:peptidylprolyl isomerase [Candidatus Polarisedimenticolaceae bacterium]